MSETKKVTKEVVESAKAVKAVKEEVKAPVVEKKEEVKAEVKKPAAKKTTTATKKTTTATKKTTTATKKTTTAAKKSEFFIQYAGKEVTKDAIEASVKAAWCAETGKKESAIKSMNIYVKMEENAAYYVINENNLGRIEL